MAARSKLLTARALARIARTPAPAVRLYEGGAVAQYDQAGFAYSDFDRAGQIPVWNVITHLEIDRLIRIWEPDFFYSSDDPHIFSVVRSQTVEIGQLFYNKCGLNWSITFRWRPGYLGRTSFTIVGDLFDKASGDEMVRIVRQGVYVNKETRVPTPVPASVARHFKSHDIRYVSVAAEKAPHHCYSQDRRVQYSDYDHQYHVTNSAYLKWCLDAAAEASLSNRFKNFTTDIAEYRLQKAETLFMGETFVPDTVNVKVWESDSDQNILLFHIDKKVSGKEEPVFFCKMAFYPLSLTMPSRL